VASRGESKPVLLRAWLDEHRPNLIGDVEVEGIRRALGRISNGYLRRLLRDCGVPLHPLVEGVVQDDLDALARTLLALEVEYETGGAPTRRRIRDLVIAAKQHCRWALRRLEADNPRAIERQEALLWMQTWLENPPVFDGWLSVRRQIVRLPHPASER
jgi:hypothetical protein